MAAKVIENKAWINTDGRRASLYGAAPSGNGWTVETNGYTIRWPDGTTGIPFGAKQALSKEDLQNSEKIKALATRLAANGFDGFSAMAR